MNLRKLYYTSEFGVISTVTFEELAAARATPIATEAHSEGIDYTFLTDHLTDRTYDKLHAWFTVTNRRSLGKFLKGELRGMCRRVPMLVRSVDELREAVVEMGMDFLKPDCAFRIAPRCYVILDSSRLHLKVDNRSGKAAVFIDRANAYVTVKVPRGSNWLRELREELAKDKRFTGITLR
jgi:hypothetical protein